MKFGVPQGSILGLLLIEIYRNTSKFGKYNLTQGPLITFFGDFNHILQPSVLRAKVLSCQLNINDVIVARYKWSS